MRSDPSSTGVVPEPKVWPDSIMMEDIDLEYHPNGANQDAAIDRYLEPFENLYDQIDQLPENYHMVEQLIVVRRLMLATFTRHRG